MPAKNRKIEVNEVKSELLGESDPVKVLENNRKNKLLERVRARQLLLSRMRGGSRSEGSRRRAQMGQGGAGSHVGDWVLDGTTELSNMYRVFDYDPEEFDVNDRVEVKFELPLWMVLELKNQAAEGYQTINHLVEWMLREQVGSGVSESTYLMRLYALILDTSIEAVEESNDL